MDSCDFIRIDINVLRHPKNESETNKLRSLRKLAFEKR